MADAGSMPPVVVAHGMTVAPDIAESEMVQRADAVFEDLYAVIIVDSDLTTFAEVERACMVLFRYTADEAAALAMRVHTTGEAVAAVLGRDDATKAVSALHAGNVRARMERV